MVNREVIDQHAEEAAFLWTQRDHATTAPQYALNDLAKVDGRLEAQVDGLRIAGETGWVAAVAQLEEGRGEVFTAAALALESDDADRKSRVVEIGVSKPPLAGSLVAAMGWLHPQRAAAEARTMMAASDPEVRRMAIAGMAVHRLDPQAELAIAIESPHARLAARAMKAAAELGRVDLLAAISDWLSDESPLRRFWSAWAAVRLGGSYSSQAVAILRAEVEAGSPFAERALDLAMRAMPDEDAHHWRTQLSANAATARAGVIAMGILGDPAGVVELIAAMEQPTLARAAGNALSMITGVDLGKEHLDGEAAATDDEKDEFDIDSEFPFPAAAAVRSWWVKRAHNYVPGTRYLCGRPLTDVSLREVLVSGRQNQRAAAALELGVRHPAEVLFETRERAQWQQMKVSLWSS